MIRWADSAYPPTDAELQQAKAAGLGGWAGYFKFGNDGVLNGWADSDFKRVLAAGLRTLAYCSGFADPAACKTRAAALGIPTALDDEGGMRPDGPWVPAWLAASGAGLYGNQPVFPGRTAAFYILADYPGYNPNATWATWFPHPSGPLGWQWQGTHNQFGASVDSSWFDDAIAGLHGGSTGQHSGDEEMRYVGPFHKLTASLKAYAAGSYYTQPFNDIPAAGGVTGGAVYPVDGYRYSSSSMTSPNLTGHNDPGPDCAMWHTTTGAWVPDGIVVTLGIAGAPGPNFPASEPIESLYDAATGRYISLAQAAPTTPAPDDDSAYALKTHTHLTPATTTGPAQ